MHALVGLLGLLLISMAPLEAGTITLAWDASARAIGYRLYFGVAAGRYDTMLEVGPSLTAQVSGLPEGATYYFVATAYNAAGESGSSNAVSAVVPITPPVEPILPVDVLPPAVRLLNPLNGATLARGSQLTATAEASDNVGVDRVEFYVNGRLVCTARQVPYRCLGTVPNARRNYTIQVRAVDRSGNHALQQVEVRVR